MLNHLALSTSKHQACSSGAARPSSLGIHNRSAVALELITARNVCWVPYTGSPHAMPHTHVHCQGRYNASQRLASESRKLGQQKVGCNQTESDGQALQSKVTAAAAQSSLTSQHLKVLL
jgi:hypothetical protein